MQLNFNNIDFKTIDTTDYYQIKPLIDVIYLYNDDNVTDNDIELLTKLKTNNNELYLMLKSFDDGLKSSNNQLSEVNEIVYLVFRKIYIQFNDKQKELESPNINSELNRKRFPNIENIIQQIAILNNKFKDTRNLKTSQYYPLNDILEFVAKTKQMLQNSNKPEFKEELKKLRILAPLISRYIKLLETNIENHLVNVNKICNNTNMTQELFNDYKVGCQKIKANLKLLNEDFNPQNKNIQIKPLQTKSFERDRKDLRYR